MARVPFRLEGADELIKTFGELTRPTQRNALMRTLRREIQPLAAAVKAKAPFAFGDLEESLLVGTRLTKRQASMAKKGIANRRSTVELHFGTADPAGLMSEFQLAHNTGSAPFFRPEWEGRKMSILAGIGRTLGEEIVGAGVRAGKRRSRGTAGKR